MFKVWNWDISGPFVWDEKTQGLVLSSFFYGYVVTQARVMLPVSNLFILITLFEVGSVAADLFS